MSNDRITHYRIDGTTEELPVSLDQPTGNPQPTEAEKLATDLVKAILVQGFENDRDAEGVLLRQIPSMARMIERRVGARSLRTVERFMKSLPDASETMSEADHFVIEAATQLGFEYIDDAAEVLVCHQKTLAKLVTHARALGWRDAQEGKPQPEVIEFMEPTTEGSGLYRWQEDAIEEMKKLHRIPFENWVKDFDAVTTPAQARRIGDADVEADRRSIEEGSLGMNDYLTAVTCEFRREKDSPIERGIALAHGSGAGIYAVVAIVPIDSHGPSDAPKDVFEYKLLWGLGTHVASTISDDVVLRWCERGIDFNDPRLSDRAVEIIRGLHWRGLAEYYEDTGSWGITRAGRYHLERKKS